MVKGEWSEGVVVEAGKGVGEGGLEGERLRSN